MTKGSQHSNKSKLKMAKWHLGRKFSKKTKLKLSLLKKGHKVSDNTRRKISEAQKGQNNHNWKGGTSREAIRIRMSLEYRLWRESVFKRDNYTCIWCGKIGGKLNADHIKPFAHYPELRFAIDNGRTLCEECHKTTETFGNRVKNLNKPITNMYQPGTK